jgi:hypothetical protein
MLKMRTSTEFSASSHKKFVLDLQKRARHKSDIRRDVLEARSQHAFLRQLFLAGELTKAAYQRLLSCFAVNTLSMLKLFNGCSQRS